MGSGGLEQKDGAPPAKRTHRPRARSERWERRVRPPPPHPRLWGWERFPPLQRGRGSPPGPSAPPLRALGTSWRGGNEPAQRHPMDGAALTPGPSPNPGEVNGAESSSVQGEGRGRKK